MSTPNKYWTDNVIVNICFILVVLCAIALLAYLANEILKFPGLAALSAILYFSVRIIQKIVARLKVSENIIIRYVLLVLPYSVIIFIIFMFAFYVLTTDDKPVVETLEIIKFYTIK